MIKYIKRKNLNVDKYDACIANSIQSRIYAFSWYLDIVADNWDVLVLNDYEAVMPIPWKQKYFIKYIAQPYFCQQLGVFSIDKLSKETQLEIVKNIPNKFLKINLNFNADNFFIPKMESRINYVLQLSDSYQNLFKGFSKGRKHAVKVGEKKHLTLKTISILELIEIKEKFYAHENFPKLIIENLANDLLKNKKGFIVGVFKDENLLGGGFFLNSKNRIIYLFSSFNNEGRKHQAASFLIGNIIKQYENSNFILDFEGGSLPNIGSFFKSFGSKPTYYYNYTSNAIKNFFI
ncbi:MAG: hypothetical protein AB8B78_01895 [Polaribacter sp.]